MCTEKELKSWNNHVLISCIYCSWMLPKTTKCLLPSVWSTPLSKIEVFAALNEFMDQKDNLHILFYRVVERCKQCRCSLFVRGRMVPAGSFSTNVQREYSRRSSCYESVSTIIKRISRARRYRSLHGWYTELLLSVFLIFLHNLFLFYNSITCC